MPDSLAPAAGAPGDDPTPGAAPPLPPGVDGAALAWSTVRAVALWQLLFNSVGAAAVLFFLHLLFPYGPFGEDVASSATVAMVGYLAGIVIVAVPSSALVLDRGVRWLRAGREPTAAERRWVIGQPVIQSILAFVLWLGAGALFAAVTSGSVFGPRVAVFVTLAGIITCCLVELVLSRQFRPVFALALANAPVPGWRREILTRVMVSWTLGSAVPLIGVGFTLLFIPDDRLGQSVPRVSVLLLVGVVAGGLVLRAAVGTIAGRIEVVTDALGKVQGGDLDAEVPVTNIGELGRLQHGFNDMVAGVRERRRLEDLFGRQVGLDVDHLGLGHEPHLGGERREITALFVDLEGFTAFTERHTPEEVVTELNAFFAVVVNVIRAEGGWIHKFEGDAALCIFGAPADQPDHAARALRAAAALPADVATLPGSPRVGIGVATGHVVVGNIGTPERYEYTVIGDAVNVAARLSELAKRQYRGVLAGEDTMRAAADEVAGCWHEVDSVVVRGRSKPTRIFEPVGAQPASGSLTGGPSGPQS